MEFSCPDQQTIPFVLSINFKMPTSVGRFWHFKIYDEDKFHAQLNWAWKKIIQRRHGRGTVSEWDSPSWSAYFVRSAVLLSTHNEWRHYSFWYVTYVTCGPSQIADVDVIYTDGFIRESWMTSSGPLDSRGFCDEALFVWNSTCLLPDNQLSVWHVT